MRTLLIFLTLIGMYSCKNNTDTNKESPANQLTLNGTWKLISYYNYKDNQIVDTIEASKDYRQIKMYTDSKVMWSRFQESDSSDWFGYGDYHIGQDSLTEILDFGSKSMNKAIKEQKKFVFDLILMKDHFTQVQIDEEGNPIYAENYERVE